MRKTATANIRKMTATINHRAGEFRVPPVAVLIIIILRNTDFIESLWKIFKIEFLKIYTFGGLLNFEGNDDD